MDHFIQFLHHSALRLRCRLRSFGTVTAALRSSRAFHSVMIGGWAVGLVIGSSVLFIYSVTPGAVATSANSRMIQQDDFGNAKPSLLIFIHPQCPCTGASVEELDRVMTRCQGQLNVRAYLYQPVNQPDSWSDTPVTRHLKRIAGVSVILDRDAKIARDLGVTTSGQVLVYDRNGRLYFNGGITGARGHVGDNDGADAIIALVGEDVTRVPHETPVYGCSLIETSNGEHRK